MKSPVYEVFDIQRTGRARGRATRSAPIQAVRLRFVTLCVVLMVAAAACTGERSGATATDATAEQTETTTSAPTITSPAGPAPADDQPPEVATADALYLMQALQHGMGQIELAQAVSSRSESPVVDDVARRIIETHNGINAQLATLAAQASVTLANDAAPELQQTKARLEPLTGRNLDAAYLAAILQTYPDLLRLHESAATTATDMDVKSAAVRARSLLEGNLTEARSAYAQVTENEPPPQPEIGSPPPASATPPG